MLGGLSLAEYTWELLQKEQLAQQRDSIFARQADLAALDRLNSELYARYRSSEFSADYHSIEEIQAEYGLGNADDESTTIEVADAQSRAIEVVAKDIANGWN